MQLPRSGIARLCLVLLTAAMGLAAMKRNDPSWVGAMAAVVGVWLLAALGEMGRSRHRPFWLGFLGTTSASLLMSFGPWSDRVLRGEAAGWSLDQASYRERIGPVTLALARFMPFVRPARQGFGEVGFTGTDHYIRFIYWYGDGLRGTKFDVFTAMTGDLADGILKVPPNERPAGALGTGITGRFPWIPEYQDAGHLLASLLFGSIGGLVVLVARRCRRRKSLSIDRDAPSIDT